MGELERYGLLALVAVSVLTVGFLMEELRARGGPEHVFELKASHHEAAAVLPDLAAGRGLAERVERPGGGELRSAGAPKRSDDFDFFDPPVTLPGIEPVDAPVPVNSLAVRQVQVRSGDTLQDIAQRELDSITRWKEILVLNDGIEPDRLRVDSWLVLPPAEPRIDSAPRVDGEARTYVVTKGDNFTKIARRFYSDDSKWMKIFEANRDVCPSPERLQPGTRIVIP